MKVHLENSFTDSVRVLFEHSIAVNGCSYLVIFGEHINGGFIAIPNWNICVEASWHSHDTFYNTERLIGAGMDSEVAEAIAEHIDMMIQLEEEKYSEPDYIVTLAGQKLTREEFARAEAEESGAIID
ncbi:MAG: hypothetical protein ILA13_00445 [Eubacterium sp.]|nr:hypothetical protein [Eubacterium sp.]